MKQVRVITRRQELETVAVLAVFMLVLAWLTHRYAYVVAALLFVAATLSIRPLANRVARIWLRFAELLAVVNSRIILTLLFFLVLSPVALVYRLFAKKPLMIQRQKGTTSYYCERDHLFGKEDLEKMW